MTIYSQAQEVAIERISKKNSHICVIGVGTIGLPLATFLAKNGFSVKGLDVNEQRVNEINSGNTIYEYQNDLKTLVNGKQGWERANEVIQTAFKISRDKKKQAQKDKDAKKKGGAVAGGGGDEGSWWLPIGMMFGTVGGLITGLLSDGFMAPFKELNRLFPKFGKAFPSITKFVTGFLGLGKDMPDARLLKPTLASKAFSKLKGFLGFGDDL